MVRNASKAIWITGLEPRVLHERPELRHGDRIPRHVERRQFQVVRRLFVLIRLGIPFTIAPHREAAGRNLDKAQQRLVRQMPCVSAEPWISFVLTKLLDGLYPRLG
jgi:hypothetical protein